MTDSVIQERGLKPHWTTKVIPFVVRFDAWRFKACYAASMTSDSVTVIGSSMSNISTLLINK